MITYTDKTISIDSIIIESRIREVYDGDSTKEESTINSMMESIKEKGLINPILVKETDGGKYILIAGFRRLTACTKLAHTSIRCSVVTGDISSLDEKELEMMENLQRKQLEWWERDKGVHLLHKMRTEKYGEKSINNPKGWDQKQTAELLNKQPSTVSQHLMVADMIQQIPELTKLSSEAEAISFIKNAQQNMQRTFETKQFLTEVSKTPVNIRKQTLINAFQVGDFFEKINSVSNNSIDFLHIDPPFGIDLNEMRKESNGHKSAQSGNYNEIDKSEFESFLWNVLNLAIPKLKQNGWGVLWFGWEWFELNRYYLEQLADIGIPIPGLWIKDRGQVKTPHRYISRTTTPFFYFRPKDGKGKLNKQHTGHYDYRVLIPKTEKIHRTEMPIEMLTDVMSTFIPEGCSVLDCFAGSGNLGLASANYNCKWLGFDLSQENKMYFEAKVHRDEFGEYRSYKYGKTEEEITDADIN